MTYLIDTNIFVTPQNDYYCNTFHPGFWEFLSKHIKSGEIIVIEGVYNEIAEGHNYVATYIKELKDNGTLELAYCSDSETQKNYGEIVNIVQNNGIYKNESKEKFLSGADPFIIAKAKTMNATVVTLEAIVSQDSAKVKIPNICNKFEVGFINLKQLIEKLSPTFSLT